MFQIKCRGGRRCYNHCIFCHWDYIYSQWWHVQACDLPSTVLFTTQFLITSFRRYRCFRRHMRNDVNWLCFQHNPLPCWLFLSWWYSSHFIHLFWCWFSLLFLNRCYLPLSGSSVGVICTVGASCSAGSASPSTCSPGSFSSVLGLTSCTLCPAGTYSSNFGATVCVACPPGSFWKGPDTGKSSCGICVGGSFCSVAPNCSVSFGSVLASYASTVVGCSNATCGFAVSTLSCQPNSMVTGIGFAFSSTFRVAVSATILCSAVSVVPATSNTTLILASQSSAGGTFQGSGWSSGTYTVPAVSCPPGHVLTGLAAITGYSQNLNTCFRNVTVSCASLGASGSIGSSSLLSFFVSGTESNLVGGTPQSFQVIVVFF